MARVLIIEDHPPDVYLLREAFRRSGISVDLVHIDNGSAAQVYLSSCGPDELPDLIFLDLNLPKLRGMELLRLIREGPELKNVPVAVLTSSDSNKDREDAYQRGANLFITKPAAHAEFFSVIAGAVRQLLPDAAHGLLAD